MNTVIPLKQNVASELAIGPCTLLASENTLVFEGQHVRLEPRVTQVLLALSQRPNAVVTREELISGVWAGRTVTDDAITRCISRLRKAFQDELKAPIKIETLAKSGYRLEFENTPVKRHKSHRIRLTLGLLIPGMIAVWSLFRTDVGSPADYQREALVVSEQWERYPEFSRDGELITFSQGKRGVGMAVFVKQFNGKGELKLTPGQHYDHQPSFSPDGKDIAFARIHQEGCHLYLIPTIGGTETRIGRCGARGVKDLTFTPDGQYLWIVTSDKPLEPGRLSSLHIKSGKTRNLTLELAQGIDDLAISPQGRIAVSAHFELGVEDVFISQLDDLDQWKRITHQNIKIHGLGWSADGENLLYTSNRSGPFELWQHHIKSGRSNRIHQALIGGDALSQHPDGHILLERWQQESEVTLANTGGDRDRILIAAKGVNWDAQFDPSSDKLLYVSDRSGSAELWIRDNGQDRQITKYEGPWVMSPRWSPDGQKIAFTVPIGNAFQLHVYDLTQNKTLETLAETDGFSPSWSHDSSRIYFGSKRTGTWQIYEKNVRDNTVKRVSENGGKVAQISQDGRFLYLSKSHTSGLWRIDIKDPSQEIQVLDDLAPVDWNNWRLVDDAIFYVRRRPGEPPLLRRLNLISQDNEAVKALSDFLYFSGVNFDKKGSFTFASVTKEDADIDLLKINAP